MIGGYAWSGYTEAIGLGKKQTVNGFDIEGDKMPSEASRRDDSRTVEFQTARRRLKEYRDMQERLLETEKSGTGNPEACRMRFREIQYSIDTLESTYPELARAKQVGADKDLEELKEELRQEEKYFDSTLNHPQVKRDVSKPKVENKCIICGDVFSDDVTVCPKCGMMLPAKWAKFH